MRWRIAADTGGTFTDCHAVGPSGEVGRCKVLSSGCLRARVVTWDAESGKLVLSGLPAVADGVWAGWQVRRLGEEQGGVVAGMREGGFQLTDAVGVSWEEGQLVELLTGEEAPVVGVRLLTGTAPGEVFPEMEMRLATTRATNALLEGKGSATVLWVNEGLGDLLMLGDQRRSELFALHPKPRAVFAEWVAEVSGRLAADGTVLEELDEEQIRREARVLIGQGVVHAAVALLHSVTNGEHEEQMERWLLEEGFVHVSVSSRVAAFPKLLPRAQSAVANATLTGPVRAFVEAVAGPLAAGGGGLPLQMMTSAGGLEPASRVQPKDLLLSGPAAGVIGALAAARKAGVERVLTLDMGGTSTDVARLEGRPGYRFIQRVGDMELMAPTVAIETVAAGGGSVCDWGASGLRVGPESAGSDPGPACYGKGGPLTITDVNLLLGRFEPGLAPIPLDVAAAERALGRLRERIEFEGGELLTREALLGGLLRLAVEHMAGAMRRISVVEGYDPAEYALLAFGGAGPQHACDVAERLGVGTVLVPADAGILSAVGLQSAVAERFAERAVGMVLEEAVPELLGWVAELKAEATERLRSDTGQPELEFEPPWVGVEMRLRGQELPLQVVLPGAVADLGGVYAEAYEAQFGYAPPADREVEVVSLRVSLRVQGEMEAVAEREEERLEGSGDGEMRLLQNAFSTLVVLPGWEVRQVPGFGHRLERVRAVKGVNGEGEIMERELLRHRLHSVVEDMGALLQRTALSTNIRERLDFSCALLDAEGRLISSAPHIPVHLGALGVCVRAVMGAVEMGPGDTIITNHPAYGGSHLPDVTLITSVHDGDGRRLGFVANRAHHAEIGGLTPGSMPAAARCLEEEGVVIAPMPLIAAGQSCLAAVEAVFRAAAYPSRRLADNVADLHAQMAANQQGAVRLVELAGRDGEALRRGMRSICEHSRQVLRSHMGRLPDRVEAEEMLDDGSRIRLVAERSWEHWKLDFTGSSAPGAGNLNATPAIVSSAVLYALRVWVAEDLPLNEGLLEDVEVVLPESFLNPPFSGDAARDPAVVGGNVEVSQRLVDTLFKALDLQACSQGTMNNLLFGNDDFGYYETVAGGGGGGPDAVGASGVHTHMTNTAITDAEILEMRYPVRLRRFAIREGSGGAGQWRGGDGVEREFEFLEPLEVSLLTQHRKVAPYGLHGGSAGKRGRQWLWNPERLTRWVLESSATIRVESGDRLTVLTPGGGGWGQP